MLKMGRLMGFEPMYIGTTIRGLNHLTTGAIYIKANKPICPPNNYKLNKIKYQQKKYKFWTIICQQSQNHIISYRQK